MIQARSLFLLSSLVLGAYISEARAVEWSLESDRNGIKIFSKKEENSPVLSFKGEGILDFNYDETYKVLANPAGYDKWMPMVKTSRVMKVTSPTEKVVYIHIGMPWPVKDRFFINLGVVKQLDSDSHLLEIKSIPSEHSDPDKVEGWTNFSYMRIKKLDGGKRTFLEIELNQDPRGGVPVFMVNWVQSSWPRDFFENIKAYMKKNSGT